jgi:hypothetical protein
MFSDPCRPLIPHFSTCVDTYAIGERVFYCRKSLHKASSHRIILLVLLLVRSTPTTADTNIYRNGDTRMALTDTGIKQAK